MIRSRIRYAAFAVFLAACGIMPTAAAADALSVTFGVAGLPSTITLCRDPTAIQFFSIDEQWGIGIDIDNDAGTGAPSIGGVDVLLMAHTPAQPTPCTPNTANTADSIVVNVLVWSAAQSTFVPSDATATVSTDFSAHSITVSSDLSGPLGGLDAASRLLASTIGFYQPTMGAPAVAQDASSWFVPGAPLTLAANDVQGCTAPCSPSADWYPMIDLVGVAASIVPGDSIFIDGFESPPPSVAP